MKSVRADRLPLEAIAWLLLCGTRTLVLNMALLCGGEIERNADVKVGCDVKKMTDGLYRREFLISEATLARGLGISKAEMKKLRNSGYGPRYFVCEKLVFYWWDDAVRYLQSTGEWDEARWRLGPPK